MSFLFQTLKGVLIGVCAILPGVSGSVLSIVFGVYEPLMAFLAHPVSKLKQSLPLLLPVLIGGLAGILLLSKAIGVLLERWEIPVMCVFAGLMVRSLPSLYKDTIKKGHPRHAWIYAVVTAILAIAWLFFTSQNGSYQPSFTLWWWVLCGVIWGLGFIIPGISPSAIFLLLNAYQHMSESIGNLDLSIVLPMAAGLIVTVALLSRFINHLLTRWYAQFMFATFGIVFIFTLAILRLIFSTGIDNALICGFCFCAGFAAAYGMQKLSGVIDRANRV